MDTPEHSVSANPWSFVSREWSRSLLWVGLAVCAAATMRLLLRDASFGQFLSGEYLPFRNRFEGPKAYLPYVGTAAIALLLASVPRLFLLTASGLRSWWVGAVSGLRLLPFVFTFIILTVFLIPVWRCLLFELSALVVLFAVAYWRDHVARCSRSLPIREEDIRVPDEVLKQVSTNLSESDDPIHSWSEDAVERAPIIDALSLSLLSAQSPVVALLGELGSGKTSVLNLLRSHLFNKAIVVSFSTWLPGSPEALCTYLLTDIAKECSKHYLVPGLRKDARRVARALARNIPVLGGLSDLLSTVTQKEEIDSLAEAISRLPKRVVVLLGVC